MHFSSMSRFRVLAVPLPGFFGFALDEVFTENGAGFDGHQLSPSSSAGSGVTSSASGVVTAVSLEILIFAILVSWL